MQRRKKQKNELERWAERAAEGIIFRPDQREVERELLAHLEDKAADLARIFPDMEREEAEKRAGGPEGNREGAGPAPPAMAGLAVAAEPDRAGLGSALVPAGGGS